MHNYKFGKTVTIPFPDNFSETPYNVIAQNKKLGLHTLCLLDLKANEKQFLSINQAIAMLLEVEQKNEKGVITPNTVAVGIARAGSDDPLVRAGSADTLQSVDFGLPLQILIVPAELHDMERSYLEMFAGL